VTVWCQVEFFSCWVDEGDAVVAVVVVEDEEDDDDGDPGGGEAGAVGSRRYFLGLLNQFLRNTEVSLVSKNHWITPNSVS